MVTSSCERGWCWEHALSKVCFGIRFLYHILLFIAGVIVAFMVFIYLYRLDTRVTSRRAKLYWHYSILFMAQGLTLGWWGVRWVWRRRGRGTQTLPLMLPLGKSETFWIPSVIQGFQSNGPLAKFNLIGWNYYILGHYYVIGYVYDQSNCLWIKFNAPLLRHYLHTCNVNGGCLFDMRSNNLPKSWYVSKPKRKYLMSAKGSSRYISYLIHHNK